MIAKNLAVAIASLGFVLGAFDFEAIGQTADDDGGKLITDAFAASGLTGPAMGWILPSGEVVTELKASSITLLVEKQQAQIGRYVGAVRAEAVKAYVEQNRVDCDRINEKDPPPLYRYATVLPARKLASQILVFSGWLRGQLVAGLESFEPTPAQMEPVQREIIRKPGQQRLLLSYRQPGRSDYFVFAAVYDRNTTMKRNFIFLLNKTGEVLAKRIETVNGEEQCVDCGVLTLKDGLSAAFALENIITMPGLPHPVLLEDTSTVEGRATSLFTFSAEGKPSEFRTYEYMATCILGSEKHD
jgi:hypothetical protein